MRGFASVCLVAFCLVGLCLSPNASAAEDFIHAWKLDNNTVDSALTRYDGSTVGGVTFVGGKVGQGLSFDGTTGFVDIVHPGPLLNQANYTIQLWAYPTVINGLHALYSEGTPNLVMLFGIEAGRNLVLVVFNQQFPPNYTIVARSQNAVVPLNAWSQLTVTLEFGGVGVGTARFYVNGVAVGSAPSQFHTLAETQYAAIGESTGGQHGATQGHSYFNGVLDDVRLFPRVLATNEICSGAFKLCGTTCVPVDQCCTACTTPPSSCFKATGTCVAGECTYAFANGTACNADNTKCTPNDTCSNGTCVADKPITCPQLACHGAPACNPNSGNCESIALDGVACGGNLCAAAGVCAAGVCSGGALVDCSKNVPVCQVGLCLMESGQCGTSNVLNDTPCEQMDRCLVQTACSGGKCVGTPKACTPSSTCVQSNCNSGSGACEESPLPDGTPCDGASCSDGKATSCHAGSCQCEGAFAGTDMGTAPSDGTGCDLAAQGRPFPYALVALMLVALLAVARSRSR